MDIYTDKWGTGTPGWPANRDARLPDGLHHPPLPPY